MSTPMDQYGLSGLGSIDPVPQMNVVQPGNPAPQMQPAQAPAAPQQPQQPDPMAAIMGDITKLLKTPQPALKLPDTSADDAAMKQGLADAKGSEKQLEGVLNQEAGLAGQMQQKNDQFNAGMDQLMARYPTEQVAYGAAMHAAPVLSILATLGGKAAGLSGTAMMGALSGMMEGLNTGAADQFKQSLDKWKQELANYKERHEQQKEMYEVLLKSYGARTDAAQKARDFALEMTHDSFDMKEAKTKDAIELWKARSQALDNAERVQLMMDKVLMQMQGQAQIQSNPGMQQLDAALTAAGVQMPGAGRGGQLYFQKLQDLMRTYPDKSPQEIAQMVKTGKLEMKGAETEMTTAARKEASIGAAQEAMNNPGGLWDQVNAAAKKVNFGDAKFANNMRLAAQGSTIADKDIQGYVSAVMEARAELSQIFARNGQTTDAARSMAEHAIPLASSYEELQEAETRSKQGAQAVRAGNKSYMDQIAGRGGQSQRTPVARAYSGSEGRWWVRYSDGTEEPEGAQSSK